MNYMLQLIQFLVTMVGNQGRGIPNMKRKMPLMINEAPIKKPRMTRQISIEDMDTVGQVQSVSILFVYCVLGKTARRFKIVIILRR